MTIRQLAQIAGVSICTVSKALRNDPRLRPETIERIKALATQYHYHPNRLTQGLISGKSKTLVCIVPEVTSTFHARVLRGVMAGAFAASFHVITVETHNQLLKTVAALHACIEQRVEGVLIASEHYAPMPQEIILELRNHQIGIVGLDATLFETRVDLVRTDEDALARIAVEYLLQSGHRTIAYVGPLPDGPLIDRSLALSRVFRAHHLSRVHFIDTQTDQFRQFNAGQVLDCLLHAPLPPTAVIVWQDLLAARLLQEAIMRGIAVPAALSILSCANYEVAELTVPRLTSIEQFPEEIGRQAVALLLRRLEEEDDPCPCGETVIVQPQLVVRDSCAPPHRAATQAVNRPNPVKPEPIDR